MVLKKRCTCHEPQGCEHAWHYEFMVDRKAYRKSTCTSDWALAVRIERHVRGQAIEKCFGLPHEPHTDPADLQRWHARGRLQVKPNHRSEIPLWQFYEIYLAKYARLHLRASTIKRHGSAWLQIDRVLGDCSLELVDGAALAGFAAARSPHIAPASVDRELAVISGILGKAVEWGFLQKRPRIPFLKKSIGRTHWLNPSQVSGLLDWFRNDRCAEWAYTPIALLAMTGARSGEVLSLKWEECEGSRLGVEHGALDGVDLVLGGFVRSRGRLEPTYLARKYDEQGTPVAYRKVGGLRFLKNERYAKAFLTLPPMFTYTELSKALDDKGRGAVTAQCRDRFEALGLIRRNGSRGCYEKVEQLEQLDEAA